MQNNITPIIVFDGNNLPLKAEENRKRDELRRENYKKGVEAMKLGDLELARKYFILSLSITPKMIYQFIKVRKEVKSSISNKKI